MVTVNCKHCMARICLMVSKHPYNRRQFCSLQPIGETLPSVRTLRTYICHPHHFRFFFAWIILLYGYNIEGITLYQHVDHFVCCTCLCTFRESMLSHTAYQLQVISAEATVSSSAYIHCRMKASPYNLQLCTPVLHHLS